MTHQCTGEPIELMLVEDNPGDVDLTLEALRELKLHNRISVAHDGVEALARLTRHPPHADHPRPDLILLDLNLPRMDGRELLAAIRGDPALSSIPVIVLSSSAAERDIAGIYALHANCYVTKPVELEDFLAVIRSIQHFWLTVARLPS